VYGGPIRAYLPSSSKDQRAGGNDLENRRGSILVTFQPLGVLQDELFLQRTWEREGGTYREGGGGSYSVRKSHGKARSLEGRVSSDIKR